MNKKILDISSSAKWLKEGNILIHPTESIWGLGCDAFNKLSVNLIFKIKKRNKNKNFILLIKSLESFDHYLKHINKNDKDFLQKHWPGPYTFLIKYNKQLPKHLKNNTGKIALRVSNHLPIKRLFEIYSGYIISTSANISGQVNLNSPNEILDFFVSDKMAYYDEALGTNKSPSTIIDLESRSIIRA